MAKPEQYSKDEESKNGMASLNERLTRDLHSAVLQIDDYTVLSEKWKEMVASLSRMATVSEMESKLPQAKDGATLWETDEQAVRFILEDGKLNVCMRSMVQYKRYMRETNVKGASEELEILENKTLCIEFEKSLGTILHSSWLHIEGIQTTDLPFLIEHISEVLSYAIENTAIIIALESESNLLRSQEIQVLLYIGLIVRQLESIREERVMPFLRQRNIFMLSIKFLLCSYDLIKNEDIKLKILTSLSVIVETEDFSTYIDKYMSQEANDVDVLTNFKKSVLAPMQSSLPREKRAQLRPLSDTIDKAKRSIGGGGKSMRK